MELCNPAHKREELQRVRERGKEPYRLNRKHVPFCRACLDSVWGLSSCAAEAGLKEALWHQCGYAQNPSALFHKHRQNLTLMAQRVFTHRLNSHTSIYRNILGWGRKGWTKHKEWCWITKTQAVEMWPNQKGFCKEEEDIFICPLEFCAKGKCNQE